MQNPASSNTCTHTFADRHIHGIAGVDFATSSTAAIRDALAFLRSRRTTAVTASIPTMTGVDTEAALHTVEPLVHQTLLEGVHLEGPFIAPRFAGAHPRDAILTPHSPAGQDYLRMVHDHQSANSSIRMMTVAPELPGFQDLVEQLVAMGIAPALGHTNADYQGMRTSIDDLYRLTGEPVVITHGYNAMRGFHHRDPGPLLAIMEAARDHQVVVELIADGQHVALEVIRWWFATYPEVIRLVSDASAATLPPGVRPLTAGTPRLGHLDLAYGTSAGPRLADHTTLASGARDLLSMHDGLVDAGFEHDHVCVAMRAEAHEDL